jgi:hypothetical protein
MLEQLGHVDYVISKHARVISNVSHFSSFAKQQLLQQQQQKQKQKPKRSSLHLDSPWLAPTIRKPAPPSPCLAARTSSTHPFAPTLSPVRCRIHFRCAPNQILLVLDALSLLLFSPLSVSLNVASCLFGFM